MNEYSINGEIKARCVHVIHMDGTNYGVLSTQKAVQLAEANELDLVEINPNTDPPVCKLMDYGKFRYQQARKRREKKHNTPKLKTIRISPVIDTGDLSTKISQARKFLTDGNIVLFDMLMKGRMITHAEVGRQVLQTVSTGLSDVGACEPIDIRGRKITMRVTSKRAA